MTKLIGYLRKDGKEFSSVGIEDKVLRKIEKPTRRNAGNRAIRLLPCENHDKPHVTVPVEVRRFVGVGEEPEILGVAPSCPLCWTPLGPVKRAP